MRTLGFSQMLLAVAFATVLSFTPNQVFADESTQASDASSDELECPNCTPAQRRKLERGIALVEQVDPQMAALLRTARYQIVGEALGPAGGAYVGNGEIHIQDTSFNRAIFLFAILLAHEGFHYYDDIDGTPLPGSPSEVEVAEAERRALYYEYYFAKELIRPLVESNLLPDIVELVRARMNTIWEIFSQMSLRYLFGRGESAAESNLIFPLPLEETETEDRQSPQSQD